MRGKLITTAAFLLATASPLTADNPVQRRHVIHPRQHFPAPVQNIKHGGEVQVTQGGGVIVTHGGEATVTHRHEGEIAVRNLPAEEPEAVNGSEALLNTQVVVHSNAVPIIVNLNGTVRTFNSSGESFVFNLPERHVWGHTLGVSYQEQSITEIFDLRAGDVRHVLCHFEVPHPQEEMYSPLTAWDLWLPALVTLGTILLTLPLLLWLFCWRRTCPAGNPAAASPSPGRPGAPVVRPGPPPEDCECRPTVEVLEPR